MYSGASGELTKLMALATSVAKAIMGIWPGLLPRPKVIQFEAPWIWENCDGEYPELKTTFLKLAGQSRVDEGDLASTLLAVLVGAANAMDAGSTRRIRFTNAIVGKQDRVVRDKAQW